MTTGSEPNVGPDIADPFETGIGNEPIRIDVAAQVDAQVAASDADSVSGADGRSGTARGIGPAPRRSGPSVDDVRYALDERAEDLFRMAFGEPVSSRAGQWRAKQNDAIAMRMRGSSRGLWVDYRLGEGGDLLDIVAMVFCGHDSARSDFPRVMEAAGSYTGLGVGSELAVGTRPAVRTEAAVLRAREEARAGEAERDAARKAALVRSLEAIAQPVKGSPAETYLAARGITRWPQEAVAFVPPSPGRVPAADLAVHSPEHGALVVWARDETGAITGG